MIYINDLRGYVSKLEQKGKIQVGSLSTSRKDRQEDKYIKSYWNAKFVGGKAVEGKIKITKGMLTNEKAENGKYYVNLTAFEWEQEESLPSGFYEDKGFSRLNDEETDRIPF